MKRSGKIILAGALLVAAAVFILLAGCGAQTRLKAPQALKIEDETLRWEAVENAAGYLVEVDGKEYEAEHNAFSVFTIALLPREYEFRVQAYGDLRGRYEDSEWSETLRYTPEIAQGWGVRLTEEGNSYEAIAYDKEKVSGKLVIPAYYNGLPIARIYTEGFAGCKNLTGVALSSFMTEIFANAFSGCSALTRVLCPPAAELKSSVFSGCTALQHIQLPQKLEVLQFSTFSNCTSLTEIALPEGLKEIHSSVFYGSALKGLTIPASVEEITPFFIGECTALETLTVAEGNLTYRSEGNCIIRRKDDALIAGCRTSVIPESVKSIGENAFSYCEGLTEITIPGNVAEIGNAAFSFCKDLRAVHIEEGVEQIGEGKEESLFSVPGEGVFAFTAMEELEIPASVKWIESGITASCQALKTITVAEGNQTYRSEGNCIIRRENAEVVGGCRTSEIPAGAARIGAYAFYLVPIEAIELPEGIEEIGEGAFGETALTGIEFPSTIREIGKKAFQKCAELKAVVFPNGLERIGASAFEESGLMDIHIAIPRSVKSIGPCAFYECHRIAVTLPASVETIGSGAFTNATVYTDSAEDAPEGWYRADPEMITIWLDFDWFISSRIVYDCALGCEGGIPYVKSYTLLKREVNWPFDEGTTVVDNVEGAGVQTLVPQREGYEFKGWALEENGEIVCGVETEEGTTTSGEPYRVQVTLPRSFLNSGPDHGTVLYAVWEKKAP